MMNTRFTFACVLFFFSFVYSNHSHDALVSAPVVFHAPAYTYGNDAQSAPNVSHCYVDVSIKPSHHYVSCNSKPNLQNYSVTELKQYFYGDSEKYIFSDPTLFMSDDFVAFAKTLPGYEKHLTSLYRSVRKKWRVQKMWGSLISGNHCDGLTNRVTRLYRQLQEERQAKERAQQQYAKELRRKNEAIAAYRRKLATITDVYGARAQALQATNKDPLYRTSKTFSVNSDMLACAEQFGIAERALAGGVMNAYEHQLHTEFIDQLDELVVLQQTYQFKKEENIFFGAVGEGIALGIEANQRQEPGIATRWADFGWEVLEVVKGIGDGAVLGVYNTACFAKNVVCHPVRTTCEMARGVGMVLCAVGKAVDVPVRFVELSVTGDYQKACKEVRALYAQTKDVLHTCATKIAAMPKRDIAKNATAFAVDWVLTGRALMFAHTMCRRAGPLLADAVEFLKKEPVIEHAVATAEGTVHYLSETAKNVGGAAKEVIKDAQLVLKSFHAEHMARLEPEIAQLRKIFDCTRKGFAEFKNKWIKIAYKHILGMELSFKKGKPKFSGCHHDFMNLFETSGFFEFANKVMHEHGFYTADVIINGKVFPKSFFPAEWSRKKVVEKICEAYQNFLINGAKAEKVPGRKYKCIGQMREGIKIEFYVTESGKMVTAYPKL